MKRIKNADTVDRIWLGQLVSVGTYYTLSSTEYATWASDDTVNTAVGNGTGVMNDGASDLGVSDGLDLLKGNFPSKVNTQRYAAHNTLLPIGFGGNVTSPAFPAIKPLVPYVVPAGKTLTIKGYLVKTAQTTTFMHCYIRTAMWKFCAVAVATPGTITLTAKTILGGGLTAAVYKWKIVAVNNIGKTLGSAEASLTLTGGQNACALSWTAVTGALYYEIYRTVAAGTTGTQVFAGATEAVSYTDVMPDSELGVTAVPGSNTTAGSVDGSSLGANFASSLVMLDVTSPITTATALDIIYRNIYGSRRYLTATPALVAGAQAQLQFGGYGNPAADNRIQTTSNFFHDVGIQDIISVGNTPATGAFNIYAVTQLINDSSLSANVWNEVHLTEALTLPAGTEVVLGCSSSAAVTTAARNDLFLIASLE